MRAKLIILNILILIIPLCAVAQNKTKLEACLAIIEKAKGDTTEVKAYNELATELLGVDDERAKQYAFKGLKLANKLNHNYFQSWSNNVIGLSYDYMGKPDSALFYYQTSIAIKNKINDLDGLGAVNMNIGVLYYYQSDYDNAIKYYTISKKYYERTNNQSRVAGILNNIAVVYKEQGNQTEALRLYEQAYDIKRLVHDTTGMANALGNIGVIYQKQKDFKKALLYYHKSIALDSLTSNKYNLVSSYISLAELHLETNQLSSTRLYLDKSIEIAKQINAIHYLDDAYTLYTKYDSLQGDYKSSNNHLKLYFFYKTKIQNEDRLKQMDKLEVLYDTKQKEQNIEILTAKEELNKLKIARQNNQLIGFIVGFILLLLLVVVIAVALKNLRRQREILAAKNNIINDALAEKEVLLKEIHHRVKNNLQVISSLLNLQSRYIKDAGALDAIKESKERINAISLLHKEIYQNEVLKQIDAKQYFSNLALNLQNTFDPKQHVKLNLLVEDVFLDIDTLIPLGLVVNELFTNCYKYGVSNENPTINFTLAQTEKIITLTVKDNGNGFPTTVNLEESNSLGFKLISLFTKKLQGNITYKNNHGANTTIVFNIK